MDDLAKTLFWNALGVGDTVWGQQHLQGPALLLGWSWRVSPFLLMICVSRDFFGRRAVVDVGVCADSEVKKHHGLGVFVP